MTAIDSMSMAEIRERYLARLSPSERDEEEAACAREARAVARRREERGFTEAVLRRLDAAARTYRRGLRLTSTEVVLLATEIRRLRAELRSLNGGAA